MPVRAQHNEAITGTEKARLYAASHRKYTGMLYGSLVKTIRRLDLPGRYLEMGAGPGFLAVMLAEHQPDIEITAVDLSPDMLAVARELTQERKLESRIRYLLGDAGDEQLAERLSRFDLVYTAFSLHHWKEPEKSIRNLWNCVQPGGALCILDFRRIWWLCSLPVKWRELESIKASYTSKEIEAMFGRIGIAGFRIKTSFPYLFQIVVARK